ncbi:uroporphyrinogen-III synthase [Novosphingobium rosa]|uniref:uroporphyrinogen-III synthase n=1 Tax=Novosphingobium rosa TaxID=76978 RepID=UPI000AB93DB9|nr:uroporphyrinogen-III synthase [Novosphingobium rosa]
MIPPLLILRPEPGNAASCATAATLGVQAVATPLFAIEVFAWQAPDPAGVDALLIGSANALRHAGPALAAYAAKPAYVVGEATAQAALKAGLQVAAIGSGGLQSVLDGVPIAHPRLLRLAGQERVALCPPPHVSLIERVVYGAVPLPLPSAIARLILTHALPAVVVALHSAQAASHFAAEIDRLALPRQRLHLATIGSRVTAAAGQGWGSIHTAPNPEDRSLLALASQLCHTLAPPVGIE